MMHSGISQAREIDDPPGLHEKTEYLLREWVNMFHSPAAGRDSTKAFSAFVGQVYVVIGCVSTAQRDVRHNSLCELELGFLDGHTSSLQFNPCLC